MLTLHCQQLNRLPQLRRRLAVVTRRQPLIHERAGVADLRLDACVREPVAVGGQLGDAAHEVTIRVAGLPVIRVVKTYHRSDVPVEVATGSSELHASVIELQEFKRPIPPPNVLQHVSMAADRTENVHARIIDLGRHCSEVELHAASLAFNHDSLRLGLGIYKNRSRVKLHHNGHSTWQLQCHQYIAVLAFNAHVVKAMFINLWLYLFELSLSSAPFAFEHCRLRVNREIVA